MTSIFDQNILPAFESIKDDGEEILWTGTPKFIPYVLSDIISGLGFVAFCVILFGATMYFRLEVDEKSLTPVYIIGLFFLVIGAFSFLKKLLSYSNTVYGYSDKRIMMRTGFIGTDFKIVDFDKISDIEVTVNVIERIFNVGSIRFFSGRIKTSEDSTTLLFDTWFSIENPYVVFKKVKQTSVDIKTDYTYPNALRPDSNPGYRTKYERE